MSPEKRSWDRDFADVGRFTDRELVGHTLHVFNPCVEILFGVFESGQSGSLK